MDAQASPVTLVPDFADAPAPASSSLSRRATEDATITRPVRRGPEPPSGDRAAEVTARYRTTLDNMIDPHVLLRAVRGPQGSVIDFEFVDANRSACHDNGLPLDELVGRRLLGLLPGHAEAGLLDRYATVVNTGEPASFDRFPYRNTLLGRQTYTDIRVVRVGDDLLSLTWRDVTDQVRQTALLAASEERFRLLAENASDLVMLTRLDGTVLWAAASPGGPLGWEHAQVVGRWVGLFLHPEDSGAVQRLSGSLSRYRCRWRCPGGAYRWVDVRDRVLLDGPDGPQCVMALRDVESEIRAERALAREIAYDALTGLPKRGAAVTWLHDFLHTPRLGDRVALCLGVRNMVEINHAYTYAGGDTVLREVANRLRAAVPPHDFLARLAGDEFVVVHRDLDSAAAAEAAARRLLDAVSGPVDVDGAQVHIAGSVGIAIAPVGSATDADALLRDATAAMREAGRRGGNRWGFLDREATDRTRTALTVDADLRVALRQDRIRPWFMPVVRLSDGRVSGFEALARWHDGDRLVPPDAFLPVAERTGLIVDVDRRILSYALDVLVALPEDQTVAVNLSAASLQSDSLADTVTAELDRVGVSPGRLHLEATETALLAHTPQIVDAMSALHDLGVTWWVDDFGTGYSSLAHLRDLPVDGVKLDRSFTAAITADATHRTTRLVHGLAGLAAGMGLDTVAEGVETMQQRAILNAQGWRGGQGWLFGRPHPTPVQPTDPFNHPVRSPRAGATAAR